ncbi:hypothetical protein BG60_28085 [Caballeronia zhejiangensis]|uniref:Uncharacterized protein n=1 Tax=Caballeronia zhejiangensis TaxID=871203 RepID=A0A656Q9I3_9BURK|nr:hypothetical protein BG60_28085 [Caballeronia zhejiangensis]
METQPGPRGSMRQRMINCTMLVSDAFVFLQDLLKAIIRGVKLARQYDVSRPIRLSITPKPARSRNMRTSGVAFERNLTIFVILLCTSV